MKYSCIAILILAFIKTLCLDTCDYITYLAEKPDYVYEFTEEEEYLMTSVAMLEGGNQGVEGIAMIYRVILNRVEDERWPNTIEEVIYQPGQFSVVSRIPYAQPNDDCFEALELIKQGWDESNGVEHFWGDGKENHFY